MSNPVKIGIVGLGRAGWGMHLSEIENKKDKFEVVAVCDIIPERTAMAKERLGCKTYGSIEELLKDDEIELVDIATRTCDHYEHALKALEAGKDVFLEKPACMSVELMRELYDRSNKPGLPRLFVRQNRRFEVVFNKFLETVRSGKLGNVFEVQISQLGYQRRDDWQTIAAFGGGQILNWGPHIIDQALVLLDSPVSDFRCERTLAAAGGDCEDHFSIALRGENGRKVNLWISGGAALNGGRHYTAYGDRGSMDCYNNEIVTRYIDPEQKLPPVVSDPGTPGMSFGASGTFAAAVEPKWIEEREKVTSEDLSVIWNYLYDSIRNGAPYPISDDEVISLMQVITDARSVPLVKAKEIRDDNKQ